jgi:RNA-directed DNA polymerase
MERQKQGVVTYQLEFDFDTVAEWACPHGEVTGASPEAKPSREQQVFAAWKEATPRDQRLLEVIADPGNLRRAYRKVKSNKGAPGVDGLTIEATEQWLRNNPGKLRQSLLDGSYKPQEVRGKSIPKPHGGERQLGIPTVRDRIVQQAIVQVLTPIIDPQMSESSYGFRPKRSAHDALQQASAYAQEGREMVVDLDLEKFFDKVNHDVLMARLAKRISDKRLLYYIRQMLKAGVIDERGTHWEKEEGTPQGGPLSPLLANVLLDDLDRELEKRGHKFCRYADDCIIMVRTMEAAKRVLKSITLYLENKLKLKVNRVKSKVVEAAKCPYLGYIIGKAGALRVPEEKINGFKEKIREATRRNRSRKLRTTINDLNAIIRGWGNYYKLAQMKKASKALDEWIRRKVRVIKLKQCKRAYTIATFLKGEGVKESQAFMVAGSSKGWWRLSRTRETHKAMNKEWFRKQGLVSLQRVVCND